MRRIIDLSLPLENFASEPFPPSISHSTHIEGGRRLAALAKIDPTDFENGMALASDQVNASTHSGTHVDAPGITARKLTGNGQRPLMKYPWSGAMAMVWY